MNPVDIQLEAMVEISRMMREGERRAVARVQAMQTGELWLDLKESSHEQHRRAA